MKHFLILVISLLISSLVLGQHITGEQQEIKESIINGNNITSVFYNYGAIGKPNTLSGIADMVWNGLGYMGEFGPLVSAEVVGKNGETLHITSDSFIRSGQGDYNPDGTQKWGWLPRAGYADPSQYEIARLSIGDNNGDGKPDSWPESWFSASEGKYLWHGEYGDGVSIANEELYFVMDDFSNAEFPYYPFPNDTTKRGLGVKVEVRIYQFGVPLEDALIVKYKITNESPKDLSKVYFGFQGDPHIGGANDYADDRVGFIDTNGNSIYLNNLPKELYNTIFNWDDDGVGSGGRQTGILSLKLLETPSDLGLTSFHAAQYTNSYPNVPKNDELMWEWLSADSIDYNQELFQHKGDNILNFGTGPFELKAGESTEVKLALMLSNSGDDMVNDVINVQLYNNWASISNDYNSSGGNENYKIELNELEDEIKGNVLVSWNYTGTDPNAKVFIDYSKNGGKDWKQLVTEQNVNESYMWDTKLNDDGVNYILRVLAYNPDKKTDYYYDNANKKFTINNPEKNAVPEFEFIPFSDTLNQEKATVKWISEDADNSELEIIVEYSTNPSGPFEKIHTATYSNGENLFYWDISSIPNNEHNFLKFTLKDGSNETNFITPPFIIDINNGSYTSSQIKHISGNGSNVDIKVIVADSLALTGNTYEIAFNSVKEYTIKNTTTNKTLLENYIGSTTPTFEGLRLVVTEKELGIDYEQTHFNRDELESTYNVFFSTANADYVGTPHVISDLDWIVVFNNLDTLSDGSWSNIGDTTLFIPSMQDGICPFKIIDIENNEKATYLIDETKDPSLANNSWNEGEDIILRPQIPSSAAEVSYALDFDFSSGIKPQKGDTLYIVTFNPIQNDDVFQFTADNNYLLSNKDKTTVPNEFVLYQNYPNPFNPSTTIKYSIPSNDVGKISNTKLVVYDILGRKIATLVDEQQKSGTYEVLFNANNIASGVYFYRLQSGSFTATKKLILLR